MQSLFETMGGAPRIRALVDHFYDVMDTDPAVKTLRDMHAKNLSVSRDKLYEFLSGWTGGPPLYVEKYGHPRLRMRHMPFAVDDRAAMEWMHCMRIALAAEVEDVRLRDQLEENFARIALHMRNRETPS